MEYLRNEFLDQLSANIDKFGNVEIEGIPFTPQQILREIDETSFESAFGDWYEQRKQESLDQADVILSLYDNADRFRKLQQLVNAETVVPFIGAGMSISSGFPGWTSFLYELRSNTNVDEQVFVDLVRDGKYEDAAQTLSEAFPHGSFLEQIENKFGCDVEALMGPVQLLPSIFQRAVITTNFDRVLEKAYINQTLPFEQTLLGAQALDLPRYLGENKKILVKLHGEANSSRDRVFIQSEYERHYDADAAHSLNDVIEALTNKSLLFLGCSLAVDRTISTMTNIIEQKGAEACPRHYAIVAIEEGEDRIARRDQLAASNIFPIWYPADQGHDDCIEALLTKLYTAKEEAT
jgi:SIR2-like domain